LRAQHRPQAAHGLFVGNHRPLHFGLPECRRFAFSKVFGRRRQVEQNGGQRGVAIVQLEVAQRILGFFAIGNRWAQHQPRLLPGQLGCQQAQPLVARFIHRKTVGPHTLDAAWLNWRVA
jgi:hypothetical protein